MLELGKQKLVKIAFPQKEVPPKLVKFIFANRFYTHKIDFLPEKVGDDLELVAF